MDVVPYQPPFDYLPDGISALSKNSSRYAIYPNPTHGIIHVVPLENTAKPDVFEVHDLFGRTLFVHQVEADNLANGVVLQLSGYPAGTYILYLRSAHTTETRKIVME